MKEKENLICEVCGERKPDVYRYPAFDIALCDICLEIEYGSDEEEEEDASNEYL